MRFTKLTMAMAASREGINETVQSVVDTNPEAIKASGSGGTKVGQAYRGKKWSEYATQCLIQIWGDETMQIALDSCKCSKESSQVYKSFLVS